MNDNLISSGLELMLFGMGTVVVFLSLLVVVTSTMSALVARYAPEETPPPPETGVTDPTLVAVITAAIHQHRSRRNQ